MEQGIKQLKFSNRNRQVGQIVGNGKRKNKRDDESMKIIRLYKLRQQIVSLKIETKKPKQKCKKLNSENMLLMEKYQLKDDTKDISQRLEKMKQNKLQRQISKNEYNIVNRIFNKNGTIYRMKMRFKAFKKECKVYY